MKRRQKHLKEQNEGAKSEVKTKSRVASPDVTNATAVVPRPLKVLRCFEAAALAWKQSRAPAEIAVVEGGAANYACSDGSRCHVGGNMSTLASQARQETSLTV